MLAWIKDMFTAGSGTSFARVSAACTILVACFAVVHVVLHTHALPDAVSIAALAAWMTAPYAISKCSAIFQKDGPQPGTIPNVQASAADSGPGSSKTVIVLLLILCFVVGVLVVEVMLLKSH